MKQISFCITCMNRLKHLQETLEKNILDNFLVDEVEFVVLDYNSQDGLEEWIAQSMMKYIEMGILVYYRTTEPVHYLRSHSRNMVFRLAEGKIVCNLDADNYLGEGFAEFMLKEFQEKKKIFYTSNLCVRDVFGRVCLEKEAFMAVKGYNELLVGYGVEDADLFKRLTCIGHRRHVFIQESFYGALTHEDNERVVEEPLLKKLYALYLDYIDPYSTRILMLYKEHFWGMGALQNNVAMNCNRNNIECDRIEQCMSDKYRFVVKEEWKEGEWCNVDGGILLNGKYLFVDNQKGLCYRDRYFYKVTDVDLIVTVVLLITEALNYSKVKRTLDNNECINSQGFGCGTVFRNFEITWICIMFCENIRRGVVSLFSILEKIGLLYCWR